MNFEEELNRMIDDMMARSGQSPGRIICNQETLDQLWEQTRMIYVSNDDIENNTGYVARFNGIPITVSSQIEPGKLFIVPDTGGTRPLRVRFGDTPEPVAEPEALHYCGITTVDPAIMEGPYRDGDLVTYNGHNFVWRDNGFVQMDQVSVYDEPATVDDVPLTFSYNHEDEDGITYTHHYQDGVVTTTPWRLRADGDGDANHQWWLRSPFTTNGSRMQFNGDGTIRITGADLSHGTIDTSDTIDATVGYSQPFTATFNFTAPEIDFDTASVDFDTTPEVERIIDKIKEGRKLSRKKKAEEEQVEIDEKKLFDILANET